MIRKAVGSDLERLTDLFAELHHYHVGINPEIFRMPDREWFSARILEMIDDREQTIFISVNDSTINGYAAVKIMNVNTEEKLPRKVCYIDCLAVTENRRHSGTGTELFTAVKSFGRENGCTYIQLGVNAYNTGAITFYEKMGLKPRTIQMEERI